MYIIIQMLVLQNVVIYLSMVSPSISLKQPEALPGFGQHTNRFYQAGEMKAYLLSVIRNSYSSVLRACCWLFLTWLPLLSTVLSPELRFMFTLWLVACFLFCFFNWDARIVNVRFILRWHCAFWRDVNIEEPTNSVHNRRSDWHQQLQRDWYFWWVTATLW